MASTHIEITGSANRHNAALRNFIDQLQNAHDVCTKLKAGYDQTANGADFASLGTELGLTTADATTIYNIVVAVNTTLTTDTNIVALLGRCT